MVRRILRFFVVVACLSASTGTALAQEAKANTPNIVLAIADDWGWPHAGALGDKAVKTPTLDRLAETGVLFEQAFVSSPSCTPSRGALLTGQHFWRLGEACNLWCQWPERRFAEFPKLLSDAGYHVGSYRKIWGPGRGNPEGKKYKSVEEFFAARPTGKPFCLLFGSSDPHRPYQAGSGKAAGIKLDEIKLFPHFPDAAEVRSDVADYYFEVQRFDREVGELLKLLEQKGELENTLVVMTGDHGMPFPRCKANVYDCGSRVPLAVRWGKKIKGGRRVTDLVSLTDLAPTFLEAAGVSVPGEMTGHSLVPVLLSEKSGRVDAKRDWVLVGRERHTQAQEAPSGGGYPVRAIRTDDLLYVRNFLPDRWPAGTPDYEKAFFKNAWLADCDNGPTKRYLWSHRDDPQVKSLYDLCFAKRPAEELYDLKKDPHQLHNVAADSSYDGARKELSERLMAQLKQTGDPRLTGDAEAIDKYPYFGGAPQWNRDD